MVGVGGSAAEQAEELFSAIGEVLRAWDGRIFEERIFATSQALLTAAPVRQRAYGDLDDGVPPTQLVVPVGRGGEIAGVQLHAFKRRLRSQLINLNGGPACGRIIEQNGCRYISLSGLTAHGATVPQEAAAMFEQARTALVRAGSNLSSIGRTWLWQDDGNSQSVPNQGSTAGRRTVKIVPLSFVLLTLTCPPCACTSERTMANPSPLPPAIRLRPASTR